MGNDLVKEKGEREKKEKEKEEEKKKVKFTYNDENGKKFVELIKNKKFEDGVKLIKGVKILNLYGMKINGSDCEVLSNILMNNNTLIALDLTNNSIGDEGAKCIGSALEKNNTLIELGLENNSIGDESAKCIGSALEKNNTLILLYLANNSIGDEGAKCIGSALEKNNTLSALGLGNNSIGDEGAKCIGSALEKNNTLITLGLENNSIGKEGAKCIGSALEKNNTLIKLYLANNSIGKEGVKCIGSALEKNNTLILLGLANNSIGKEGVKCIGSALEKNNTLIVLGLENNSIGDESAKCIGSALKKNNTLIELGLENNSIGDEGAKCIGSALEKNNTLSALGLGNNSIGDEGAKCIGSALEKNNTLITLGLENNSIGKEGAKCIEGSLINQLSSVRCICGINDDIVDIVALKKNKKLFDDFVDCIKKNDLVRFESFIKQRVFYWIKGENNPIDLIITSDKSELFLICILEHFDESKIKNLKNYYISFKNYYNAVLLCNNYLLKDWLLGIFKLKYYKVYTLFKKIGFEKYYPNFEKKEVSYDDLSCLIMKKELKSLIPPLIERKRFVGKLKEIFQEEIHSKFEYQQGYIRLIELERKLFSRKGKNKIKIKDFQIIKKIGGKEVDKRNHSHCGTNCYVYKAKYGDLTCALKVIINMDSRKTTKLINNYLEKEFLKNLEFQKNILRVFFAFKDDLTVETKRLLPGWNFESDIVFDKTIVFMMPLYDKNLKQWKIEQTKSDYVKEKEILYIMNEVLCGLCCLHKNKIVHCDIKSDNIYLTEDDDLLFGISSNIVIGDFGTCQDLSEFDSFEIPYPTYNMTKGGAPFYCPPEILSKSPGRRSFLNYDKYDIYSFGLTVYELVSSNHPFGNDKKTKSDSNFVALKDPRYSIQFRDLIQKMILEDPTNRISCYDCLKIVKSLLT